MLRRTVQRKTTYQPTWLQVILEEPIEKWPRCEALLVWESEGFPLQKAQRYVRLARPLLINNVFMQDILLDRRSVYKTLKEHNICVPPHIIVNRDQRQREEGLDPEGFEEAEDYVCMVWAMPPPANRQMQGQANPA